MKKLILVFLTLFLIMGCEKMQKIETVSVQSFEKLTNEADYTIIDVRSAEERLPANGGKIFENSLNIDFYAADFKEKLSRLDKDKKYLIYCRSGNRSGKALAMMQEMGFMEVADLGGGVVARAAACKNKDITC